MLHTIVLGDYKTMTIKQYAKERSISYESARRQVARYTKELKGHAVKNDNGPTELDEYAVEFLDKHRQKRPIVVAPDAEETQQEIDNLKAEIEHLKQKLVDAQTEIIKAKDETLATHTRYQELLERNQLLLEQKDTELQTYHKTIFGLYKKDK